MPRPVVISAGKMAWLYKNHKRKSYAEQARYLKINVDKNILESSESILENKKGIGFFSYLLVIIISLVALLVIADTFKPYLLTIVPNLDFYLSSLYESLTDIYLFFKDLLK